MMKLGMLAALLGTLACAQTSLQTPARISDSRTLPATLDTKVIEFRDLNGSGLKWKVKGEVTASATNRILFSDNSNATVLELSRKLSSTTTNEAIFDLHLIPRTDGDRIIGSASKRWGEAHINRLHSNFLAPPAGDVEVDGNVLLTAGKSLGKTAQRIPTLYVQDLDCAGTGCPSGASFWSRDSGTGRVFPTTATDDIRFRKWLIEDSSGVGGGFTWDMWGEIGNPASFSNRVFLRDNAGTKVIEFERSFLGTTSNRAYLDMHFLPRTDAVRNLGESGSRWADAYINRLRANFIVPLGGSGSTLELDGDLAISAGNSIGLPGQRVPTLYVQNLDCAGTGCPGAASGWTRNSGSGYLSPTTATDDVRFRKWQIESNEGSGLFWDFQAEVTGATPGTRRAYLRDSSGVKVIEFERSFAGAVSDVTRLDTALEPLTTNARKLGSSTRHWSESYVLSTFTQGLSSTGGSSLIAFNHTLEPGTHLTQSVGTISKRVNELWVGQVDSLGVRPDQDYTVFVRTLGTPSQRWGHLYTRDITMTGTFTCTGVGCPGASLFTDGGGTTYLAQTTDNLCIGCTVAVEKLAVTGSIGLSGSLLWSTDGAGDIGLSSSPFQRPSAGHFATAIFTYNGSGSSVIRTSLSGSGLIVRDGSGTATAQVTATGNFISNGLTGQTVTTTVAAPGGGSCTLVFTGGIKTGGTC